MSSNPGVCVMMIQKSLRKSNHHYSYHENIVWWTWKWGFELLLAFSAKHFITNIVIHCLIYSAVSNISLNKKKFCWDSMNMFIHLEYDERPIFLFQNALYLLHFRWDRKKTRLQSPVSRDVNETNALYGYSFWILNAIRSKVS